MHPSSLLLTHQIDEMRRYNIYIYIYFFFFFFLYDGIVYTDGGQKPLNLCDTQEIRP